MSAFSFGTALDIRQSFETPPPPRDFVIHGLSRNYCGGIISPGGKGKSFLQLAICAEVSTGGAYNEIGLATEAPPGRVIYLTAEEDAAIMHSRLHAIGSHLSAELRELMIANVSIQTTLGATPALVTRDGQINGEIITEIINVAKGARLLMLDPLRKFHDGDENGSADMTILTKALDRIAVGANVAVLFSHHANKGSVRGSSGEDATAARGSSAISDNIRLQLNLSSIDEVQAREYGISASDRSWFVAMDFAKTNHCSPEPMRILRRRTDGTLFWDRDRNIARILGPRASVSEKPLPKLRTLEEYADSAV